MVQEYTSHFYMPSFKIAQEMSEGDLAKGMAFAGWRSKLRDAWKQVQIRSVDASETQVKVGTQMEITASVDLGQLTADDVRVQFYYGELDSRGDIGRSGEALDMVAVQNNGKGNYTFKASVTYHTSGERGVSVRVMPYHPYLRTLFLPGLITWAKG
jgi:starch phosphorylase